MIWFKNVYKLTLHQFYILSVVYMQVKDRSVLFRLTAEDHKKLKMLCIELNVSVQKLLEEVVLERLKRPN